MEAATAGRVSRCVERFHGEVADRHFIPMVQEPKLSGATRLWLLCVDICRAARRPFDIHQTVRMIAVCVCQQNQARFDASLRYLLQYIVWMRRCVDDRSFVGRFADLTGTHWTGHPPTSAVIVATSNASSYPDGIGSGPQRSIAMSANLSPLRLRHSAML